MNEAFDIEQDFDAYQAGELTKEQMASLEQKMQSDTNFKEAFETHKVLDDIIIAAETAHVNQEVRSLFQEKKKKQKTKNKVLMGTLSILLLGIIGLLYYPKDEEVKQPDLIEENNMDEKATTIHSLHQDEKESSTVKKYTSTENPIKEKNRTEKNIQSEDVFVSVNIEQQDESVRLNILPQQEKERGLTLDESTQPIERKKQGSTIIRCMTDIKIKVQKTQPCVGEDNGQFILSASSGVKPITYFVNGEEYLDQDKIMRLSAGEYQIFAIDNEGCSSDTLADYYLSEKECFILAESFNPSLEDWVVNSTTEIRLEIRDINRKVVYIERGNELRWNGKDLHGNMLPVQQYLYLIYENEKILKKGFVSIVK